MTDDAFSLEVECDDPGPSGGEPAPRRFRFGERAVEVAELLDQWPGADHAYVKLRGADGATYILRHDGPRGLWQLVLFQRAGAAEG